MKPFVTVLVTTAGNPTSLEDFGVSDIIVKTYRGWQAGLATAQPRHGYCLIEGRKYYYDSTRIAG